MTRVHHLGGVLAHVWVITQPLRVRRSTDDEDREPQRIVRRDGGETDNSIYNSWGNPIEAHFWLLRKHRLHCETLGRWPLPVVHQFDDQSKP